MASGTATGSALQARPVGDIEAGRTGDRRVRFIDGLRGWAALSVLVFHLLYEIFSRVRPELDVPLVRALLDGRVAVYVFFVLSGFALSLPVVNGSETSAIRVVAKRYFRLAGPTLASCVLTYGLMRAGLTRNQEAGALVHRPDWLGFWLHFEPDLAAAVGQGLVRTFTEFLPQDSYNPFLWTMSVEFVGSGMIFCYGVLYARLQAPVAVAVAAAALLAFYNSSYSLFFVGVVLAIVQHRPRFAGLRSSTAVRLLSCCLVVGALAWSAQNAPWMKSVRKDVLVATSIVVGGFLSSDVVALMESRLSQFLGKVSFPLYYMQFSVLVTFTSFLIVRMDAPGEPTWGSVALIVLSSLAVVVLVAWLAEKAERRYLAGVDRLVRRWVLAPDRPGRERGDDVAMRSDRRREVASQVE